MQTYEVEIKTLLGSKENAEALLSRLREIDPTLSLCSENSQLNHYFAEGSLAALAEEVSDLLEPEASEKLRALARDARDFSVRTRQKDADVMLVAKVSVGNDSSSNGVARIEFEEKVSLSLSALDARVLSAGFVYQAKWSRTREEYAMGDTIVCIDHNAGYGYVAEFEKVVHDASQTESARRELVDLMEQVQVSELPQERLERMFAHYNAHWPEYYGTEKIFVIE